MKASTRRKLCWRRLVCLEARPPVQKYSSHAMPAKMANRLSTDRCFCSQQASGNSARSRIKKIWWKFLKLPPSNKQLFPCVILRTQVVIAHGQAKPYETRIPYKSCVSYPDAQSPILLWKSRVFRRLAIRRLFLQSIQNLCTLQI